VSEILESQERQCLECLRRKAPVERTFENGCLNILPRAA
jgi:hypothetical protein